MAFARFFCQCDNRPRSHNKTPPMTRLFFILLTSLLANGCATRMPAVAPDPLVQLLAAGEQVTLRMPAQLQHGHDMTEPSYDAPEGYRPIPTYDGELLLTDRRLLFVEQSRQSTQTTQAPPSWLSIPYGAVARARPSLTPLLNYLVVWDGEGHPDSFVVNASDVRALHQLVGKALLGRRQGEPSAGRHEIRSSDGTLQKIQRTRRDTADRHPKRRRGGAAASGSFGRNSVVATA